MPFDYAKDDAARRIRLTLRTPLALDELLASVDQQLADGAWQYGLLVDARALVTPPLAANVQQLFNHIAALAAMHGPRGPVAIVARASGGIAGAQMFVSMDKDRTQLGLEVFWDMAEAEHWLDERTMSP
jgi:hypothetical protein